MWFIVNVTARFWNDKNLNEDEIDEIITNTILEDDYPSDGSLTYNWKKDGDVIDVNLFGIDSKRVDSLLQAFAKKLTNQNQNKKIIK